MDDVLNEIASDRKTSVEEAFAALALLAQMGATSARTQSNVHVTFGKTVYKVDLIKRVVREKTLKSFRRIAKSFATEIEAVASVNGYTGNLLNKIKLNYPEQHIEPKDFYWVSDFQSENPDCPIYIRDIINKYYNDFIKKK